MYGSNANILLLKAASTLARECGNTFFNSLLHFQKLSIHFYKNTTGRRYVVAWNETREHSTFTTHSGLLM